jgi:uncharacterized lipoprotein YmbA
MMPSRRCSGFLARGVLLAALTAFIAGCGLSRPSPVKQTFLLQTPVATKAATSPRPLTVKVEAVVVAAPFRSRAFVYREGDLKYEADFYNEFFVSPSAMLTDGTGAWLAGAGVFRDVLPPDAVADGDYALQGFVSEFYGDYRDEAKPAAVITAKFFLIDNRAATAVPVWQTELTQRIALTARNPDALATAFNTAWAAMLNDLSRQLAAAKLPR